MDQQTVVALTQRLAALERQNRRMKWATIVIIAAIAALIAMGQTRPPSDITAESFTLVDRYGNKLAALTTSSPGDNPQEHDPVLIFFTADGQSFRAWLGSLGSASPSLGLQSSSGNIEVSTSGDTGQPDINIRVGGATVWSAP